MELRLTYIYIYKLYNSTDIALATHMFILWCVSNVFFIINTGAANLLQLVVDNDASSSYMSKCFSSSQKWITATENVTTMFTANIKLARFCNRLLLERKQGKRLPDIEVYD